VGAVHVVYGSLSDENTEMFAMTLYAKRMTVRGFQLFEATDDHSAVKLLSISLSTVQKVEL
jgi:hypothetical protein